MSPNLTSDVELDCKTNEVELELENFGNEENDAEHWEDATPPKGIPGKSALVKAAGEVLDKGALGVVEAVGGVGCSAVSGDAVSRWPSISASPCCS